MARLGRSLGLGLGALLLACTTLTACGGSPSHDSGQGATGSPTGTSAASGAASVYPSVPAGVHLTAPGTALHLGQSATVAWQPRQHLVGVLDITVTDIVSTTFAQSFKGWELDPVTTSSAPYFVKATVRNAGSTDLAGRAVPLYGAAASGALVEASTFASDFKPCHPGVLPKPFPAGATTHVCLVYLVPHAGALEGVSFRPTQSFDPITWSGTATPLPSGSPSVGASAAPSGEPSAPSSIHMSGSPVR
ncbi:MAG TPA: hypothetical protein VFR99_08035 [Marmoricola sp.]|nr:hypothetical protein [Marmoricola sp.]